MARGFVLRDLEKEYGDLEKIIPKLVNTGGQKYAANQLNTTQNTISNWLKANGYYQKIEWVKHSNRKRAS